jgi:2-phospho-L-lactate guanylyltransferase
VTWAVVPFRGPGGKRRLAPILDEPGRRVLAEAMLADVLAALVACAAVDRIVVISPPPLAPPRAAADVAGDDRIEWLAEPSGAGLATPSEGLNGALAHVQRLAAGADVGRLLIVPADLPLLSAEDVQALLGAVAPPAPGAQGSDSVAIAPDETESGTNALLLSPPDAIAPRFGPDSFRAHLAAAEAHGAAPTVVHRPGLALDVDTPDGLARLLAAVPRGRTGQALRALDLERLVRSASETGSPARSQEFGRAP